MLKIENISTGYENKQVLFNVTFEVGDNEVVLLTGGNGSGKSTVLKCIYCLLPLWNKVGKISFNRYDLNQLLTSDLVRKGIVYIPQKNNYFESLTVHENLIVSGSCYSKKVITQKINKVYQLPFLYEYRNRTPFNLSGGERQLLALGIGLIHNPRMLLFDEPFAGLDEENTKIIINVLLELKKQQIGMLIVEHKRTFNTFVDRELNMSLGKLI
jgi:branched-chain amino acid transport system ATP-binding protein